MRNFKTKVLLSITLIAFVLSGATSVFAQGTDIEERGQVGIRFMPTFSKLDVHSSDGGTLSGDVKMGFGAGIFLGFHFSNYIGIQGEVIYSKLSQETINGDVSSKLDLEYVNIPLLLTLNSGRSKMVNLNVVAGPQIGFNVGSSFSQTGTFDPNDPQPILAVRSNDLGLAYGAGIDIGLTPEKTFRLGLGYRGVMGLVNIDDNNHNNTTDTYYVLERSKLKTNAVYIGVSLLF